MTMPPPRRLPNGDLEILARFDGPNGEIGDAVIAIGPDDERFAVWDAYLTQRARAASRESG